MKYLVTALLIAGPAHAGYEPLTDDGPYLGGKGAPVTSPQPEPRPDRIEENVCFPVYGRDGVTVLYWTGSPALHVCVKPVKDGPSKTPQTPQPPTECSSWDAGVRFVKVEKECAALA